MKKPIPPPYKTPTLQSPVHARMRHGIPDAQISETVGEFITLNKRGEFKSIHVNLRKRAIRQAKGGAA